MKFQLVIFVSRGPTCRCCCRHIRRRARCSENVDEENWTGMFHVTCVSCRLMVYKPLYCKLRRLFLGNRKSYWNKTMMESQLLKMRNRENGWVKIVYFSGRSVQAGSPNWMEWKQKSTIIYFIIWLKIKTGNCGVCYPDLHKNIFPFPATNFRRTATGTKNWQRM